MDWAELPLLFPGFSGAETWSSILERHAEFLETAAPAVRVSSVSNEDAVRRHYAEALELLRIAQAGNAEKFSRANIVDVGSGGGFPGIPIAALLPGARVHLVEPLQKRARILTKFANEAPLPNVSVYPVRAEEAGRGPLRDSAMLVTARAVATLPELLEYVAPFAAEGAVIALPKGSRLAEELPAARKAMQALRCELLDVVPMREEISEFGRVALFRKTAPTPSAYPRKPGTAARIPLASLAHI